MSTATRVMLSRALKRSLPRPKLLLPQQRSLAAQVDDKTTRPSDEQPAHEVPKNEAFNTHHPVSTAVSWGEEFWRKVPVYSNVSSEEFLSYRWSVSDVPSTSNPLCQSACLSQLTNSNHGEQTKNNVDSHERLNQFLNSVVPDEIPYGAGTQSKEQFMDDVYYGMKEATMSLRVTHVSSSSHCLKNHTNIVSQTSHPQPYRLGEPEE